MPGITIGRLAKEAGVPIDTVRYYERNGLLSPAQRSESGYRQYGGIEVRRLRFIRRAKALGFTLEDIRTLLALSDEEDVAKVRAAAQHKVEEVSARIAELERVRTGLQQLIAKCPGHGRAEACPILGALTQEAVP